ncbi:MULTISPECIES: RICIN domain-containing protein [unclassified Streptomyces]|uniref:RICIN domain-containing protein n=1 Tax=unclassified Streptomyces TaxID=2593676 RepID=UPI0003781C6D|nr:MULTISPECIES: RICIN domain-containing protein [unclassified Streptomyces]MYY05954.1 hypothetical protein [Streptomyces sp. SID4913]
MSELPKRNVTGPVSSRPVKPLRSNDAANLDSARAALARAMAAQRAENAEKEAGRSAPAQGPAGPGATQPPAESAHEISPAAAPRRRRAFPRRARILAAVVAVVAVAVAAGVAVTAGRGSDGAGRRADAPAEGPVRPDGEAEGAGDRSPLPGASTAEQSASPTAAPSATTSPSSSTEPRSTPDPGRSTTPAGSGASSDAEGTGTDGAGKPATGKGGGSNEVHGFPLAVEASGKCLTGAGSGSQLVASACDGSSGQSWSPGADGSLRQGGLCATLTGTEDRTPVVLSGCTGASAQRVSLSGTALLSASTGKCLDLFGGASGSQIVLWECNGRDNQRWHAA